MVDILSVFVNGDSLQRNNLHKGTNLIYLMEDYRVFYYAGDKDDLSAASSNSGLYTLIYLPDQELQVDIDLEERLHLNPLNLAQFENIFKQNPIYKEMRVSQVPKIERLIALREASTNLQISYERIASLFRTELRRFYSSLRDESRLVQGAQTATHGIWAGLKNWFSRYTKKKEREGK